MRRLRARRRALTFVTALALLVPALALAPPVAAETLAYVDTHGSATASDEGRVVATDSAGNIYVAGDTDGSLPNCTPACTSAGKIDFFVRKYAADGTVAWTRQLGSAADDWPRAIGVDGSGNVYVSGSIQFAGADGALPGQTQVGTMSDGFLLKYSSAGSLLWTHQFGLSFSSAAETTTAEGLAVDSAGNAYIAGESWDTSYTADVGYVRKYDTTGAVTWEKRFAALEFATDYSAPGPVHLALNPSATTIAVSGRTNGTLATGLTNAGEQDAFVATFAASDGTMGWVREWGTAANDNAPAVAIDSQGRVAVTSILGTTMTANNVRQFSATGVLSWTSTLGAAAGNLTVGSDVAIGPSDGIAVGGYATTTVGHPAIWLFASDGTAGWSTIPTDFGSYGGVAYGPGGVLYATGSYLATETAKADMVLVKVYSDSTAPTLTLEQKAGQADPTNASPVNFSVVADEALDTTTVTAADFSITNGTIGSIACTGTPTTCTIPVTPTADGAVAIAPASSPDFSISDVAGNAQTTAGGTDRTITYDHTAPTLTLEQKSGQADPTNTSPVNFSLVSNEPLDTSTVTAAAFSIENGNFQGETFDCSGTPLTCTIPVVPIGDGTVTISLSKGFAVADLAGNVPTTVEGTDRSITYSGPTAPANDDFAEAATLPGLSGSIAGTTVNATFEEGEVWGMADVWYQWTNTSRKDLVAVFTVSGCDTWVTAMTNVTPWTDWDVMGVATPQIDCATTDATMRFVAAAGATYAIQAMVDPTGDPAAFTLGWTTESVIRGSLVITITNTRGDPASCTVTVKGTSLLADQAVAVLSWDADAETDHGQRLDLTTEAGRWSPSTTYTGPDTYWSIESIYEIKTDPNALLSADGASPVIAKVVNRCHS